MDYRFCIIRINSTKYDVTVATRGKGVNLYSRGYVTADEE